jgi:hypothetical protein
MQCCYISCRRWGLYTFFVLVNHTNEDFTTFIITIWNPPLSYTIFPPNGKLVARKEAIALFYSVNHPTQKEKEEEEEGGGERERVSLPRYG